MKEGKKIERRRGARAVLGPVLELGIKTRTGYRDSNRVLGLGIGTGNRDCLYDSTH